MITAKGKMESCLMCIKTYSTLHYIQFISVQQHMCHKGKFIVIYKNIMASLSKTNQQ